MVINTNRLILRPFKVEDATSFYEITQDKAIKEYVPYASPESVEESQQYIITYYANGDFIHDFYFIIELQSTHEIIGSLIVTQNLEKEFDMSLVISKNTAVMATWLKQYKHLLKVCQVILTLFFS